MEDKIAATNPSTQVPSANSATEVAQGTPEPQQQQPIQEPTPALSYSYSAPKKPFPKILIIIIIIAVLGIGSGLLFGNNKSSLPKGSQQPDKTTHSTQPKSQQPGFTTYTNDTNKFSIQYPDDMQVKENTVGMGVSTIEMRSEDNLDEKYLADIQMMTIPNYLAKAIGQDFNEYYNMSENTSKTITAQEKSRVLTKVRNRSINNLRAFEFKSTDDTPSADEVATIGVYVEIGDKILIISTQEDNRDNLEKMLENFTYNP